MTVRVKQSTTQKIHSHYYLNGTVAVLICKQYHNHALMYYLTVRLQLCYCPCITKLNKKVAKQMNDLEIDTMMDYELDRQAELAQIIQDRNDFNWLFEGVE